jgi:alpha-D-xyloside xylohydrolase
LWAQASSDFPSCDQRLLTFINGFMQAVKAHLTGVPMMRSMILEFPDDPTSQYLDQQE